MKQINLHQTIRKLFPYLCFITLLSSMSFPTIAQGPTLNIWHININNGPKWFNGDDHLDYAEGNVVPFMATIQNLTVGNSYTIEISYDATKNQGGTTANAYDYLDIFNTTVNPTVPAGTVTTLDVFSSVNGTITNVSGSSSTASYTVTFQANSSTVYLLWGGHLAVTDNNAVPPYLGAGQIHGAPYHMNLVSLNGNAIGQQNRSVMVKKGSTETCTPPDVSDASITLCETTAGSGTASFDLTSVSVTSDQTATIEYYSDVDLTQQITGPDITSYTAQNNTTVYAKVIGSVYCFDVAYIYLYVNPLPTVTVNSPIKCANDPAVTITATPGSGSPSDYSYKWTVPGGVADPGNVQSFSATVAGQYCVVITNNTTQCASASDCGTLTVNPNPPCIISSNGSSTTATVGSSVTFSGPTQIGTYEYTWSFSTNTSGASFVGGHGTGDASVTVTTSTMGSYTLTLSVKNTETGCTSAASCSYYITVTAIGPSLTYTQGFYGNLNGLACGSTKQNPINSSNIMAGALTAAGGSIRFGNQLDTRSFTLISADVANSKTANIYKMLPGGTTPAVLKSNTSWKASCNYPTATFGNNCTWPGVPIVSSSISNVLLAQTMTLKFNLYFSSNLGALTLTGNVLTFAKPTTTCGSTYASTGTTQTIPCTVFKYLVNHGGATINNLYQLANDVLGGVVTSVTPSDVNAALNVINTGFDGGGSIIGVSTSSCTTASRLGQSTTQVTNAVIPTDLSVVAYPNPFTSKVRFAVASPVSGEASLDVYNIVGQKLANVYKGYLSAGNNQVMEYNVPLSYKGALIYTLKVGNLQVSGKVIQEK